MSGQHWKLDARLLAPTIYIKRLSFYNGKFSQTTGTGTSPQAPNFCTPFGCGEQFRKLQWIVIAGVSEAISGHVVLAPRD